MTLLNEGERGSPHLTIREGELIGSLANNGKNLLADTLSGPGCYKDS